MSHHSKVYQSVLRHQGDLMRRFPCLSRPQAQVLGLWCVGVMVTGKCSLTRVSLVMAGVLGRPSNTMRQRLREWYLDAPQKRGRNRRGLDVEPCFPFLARWALSKWKGRDLVLGLDATSLGERFVVLCVSLLFRSCAIPLIWTVLPAKEPDSWRKHWLRMLRQLRPAIPPSYRVLVMADRGLFARWLFRRIVRLGWHPFMRINKESTFRPDGERDFLHTDTLTRGVEGCGALRGTAFKTDGRRLNCTLAIYHEKGCAEPWFVLTDIAPEGCHAYWYGLRSWIEQGFKRLKSGGWCWPSTRINDPARTQRFWLVLAVTTLWSMLVGSHDEDRANSGQKNNQHRTISLFLRSTILVLLSLCENRMLPWYNVLKPEALPSPSGPRHADDAPLVFRLDTS